MTDRKIITFEQWKEVLSETGDWEWIDLPDAPKHTDEEYELLEKEYETTVKGAYARIKELEASAPQQTYERIESWYEHCNVVGRGAEKQLLEWLYPQLKKEAKQ